MKVLIVRIGAMGDVLHALPAVAGLRRAHPDWQIDWAVDTRWRDLLIAPGEGSGPVVSGTLEVRTREWNARPLSVATLRDVLGVRRRLRAERYDVSVDLQGTMRSAVIGWMAGGGRFLGPKEPREGPAMRLYGEAVDTQAMHVIDQALEILACSAGGALAFATGEGLLPIGTEEEQWAADYVSRLGGKGVVVVAPSAGWRSKEWQVERFGEVAGRLAKDGWTVLVNATARGEMKIDALAEAVCLASGGRAQAVMCTIAQLASLLRRASLFVGGDTGPMHLADALGVPVVALFGPTDPARTGPRGERTRTLRHPSSVTDHGRYRETEAGLARITVEEVYEAARELLGVTTA